MLRLIGFWVAVAFGGMLVAAVAAILLLVATRPTVVHVPADHPSIAAALDAAPDGATVQLAPGRYEEQVTIGRPVRLAGPDSGVAEIAGIAGEPVVTVRGTSGVVLSGLTILGGEVGIYVTEADNVRIFGNTLTGSELRGIRVMYASADIEGNTIDGMRSIYSKGIHVANNHSWPLSTIRGNTVRAGAGEGITTNMAHAVIEGNVVESNDSRGITVGEMSVADVVENDVMSNGRAGIWVVDMSHASISGNLIEGTRPMESTGDGIRIEYHSEAAVTDNDVARNHGCAFNSVFDSRALLMGNSSRGNQGGITCGAGAEVAVPDQSG